MEEFTFEVNGQPFRAKPGQTIAAALMAAGHVFLRRTPAGAPRGLYCGMGVCFECLVEVDGDPGQRACVTTVKPGMQVRVASDALSDLPSPH